MTRVFPAFAARCGTAALAAFRAGRAAFGLAGASVLPVIALLALPAPAHAQTASDPAANTDDALSQAAILRSLYLTKLRDLDFGGIIATPAGGTVVLDPSGAAGCAANGVIHVGDICQPADFGGGGESGRIIKIKLPQDITITGPGTDMLIDTLALDTSPDLQRVNTNGNQGNNGYVRYRIVSPTGVFRFRLGGRLNVNANQAPGEYTGEFEVQVDYQ